jgi:enoyl-CoA hydratase/carnithine racemase
MFSTRYWMRRKPATKSRRKWAKRWRERCEAPVRLRGAGADFCRGRQSPQIDRARATAIEFRQKIAHGPLRLYDAFRECPAPVLVQVQGQALGVGCALAALGDLTVAAEDAVFSVPEMQHGIPPTLVISALADRLPYKAVAHLVLTRERIGAERALACGIISQIAPAAGLQSAADAIEKAMLSCSAAALQGVKEYLQSAPALAPRARSSLASSIIATVQASQNRS